jgi:hypothetical protein
MRILQVIPTYLPATRYGGPIVAVHALNALARALIARGHDVEVVTTNVNGAGASAAATSFASTAGSISRTRSASSIRR